MELFNRLPGTRRAAPGVERTLLRHLPSAVLAMTLLPLLPSVVARVAPGLWSGGIDAGQLMMIDIYAASIVVLCWTLAFTGAIAAFIVLVMKGPGYVADAYPLQDAERPERRRRRRLAGDSARSA